MASALMLGGSLVLWAGLYFLVYWVELFFTTTMLGVDAAPPEGLLPKFALIALILCGIDWGRKLLRPYSRLADRKPALKVVLEAIFALPNLTVSSLQTLTALRALSESELEAAWRLLQKITREEYVRVQELPLEIPNEGARRRVMLSLQLTKLIELQAGQDGVGFRVADEKAKRLGQEHVRIKVG
jgi:hypothetical protein